MADKKLIEAEPASLDVESLSLLQASLTAKLILTNKELSSRWKNLAVLSSGAEHAAFAEGVKWLRGFNVLLETALAHITRKPS
jgi:hypothetical protein